MLYDDFQTDVEERARAAGMMNAQMGMGNAPLPFVPIPPADSDQ